MAPNGIQWPLIDSPEDALREGVVIRCFDLFGARIIGRTGRDEDLSIGLYSGFSGGGWLLDFGRRDHRFLMPLLSGPHHCHFRNARLGRVLRD